MDALNWRWVKKRCIRCSLWRHRKRQIFLWLFWLWIYLWNLNLLVLKLIIRLNRHFLMQILFIFYRHLRGRQLLLLCIVNDCHSIVLLKHISFQNFINISAYLARLEHKFFLRVQFRVIRDVRVDRFHFFFFILFQVGVFGFLSF